MCLQAKANFRVFLDFCLFCGVLAEWVYAEKLHTIPRDQYMDMVILSIIEIITSIIIHIFSMKENAFGKWSLITSLDFVYGIALYIHWKICFAICFGVALITYDVLCIFHGCYIIFWKRLDYYEYFEDFEEYQIHI